MSIRTPHPHAFSLPHPGATGCKLASPSFAARSRHIGDAPQLAAVKKVEAADAHSMMAIDELMELSQTQETTQQPGFRAVRAFIRDPHLLLAARVFDSLRALMPDGSTIKSVTKHLKAEKDDLLAALALLESYAAIEIDGETVRVAPKFFWEKTS